LFGTDLKFAIRNCKSAMLSAALLFALCVFTVLLIPLCSSAWAQQPRKVPRIGYLSGAASFSAISARTEALQQGLRKLGYIEGKNILIEWRSSEGNPDRLPGLARDLVRHKVDVIVTGGSTVTRIAKEAT